MDIIITILLALFFVGLLGWQAVAYLLAEEDDEPWVNPQPWRGEEWEMRRWQ